MDPITLLVAVLGIYGSGIVAKAGEDTFDHCRQLLTAKLKGSDTGRALAAGTEIDPEQAVIDVEAISCDPEVQALAEKIQQLIAQNDDLQRQFQEAQRRRTQKNSQINRDKSQGYQFNEKVEAKFIGGNHTHYHGVDPDD